MIGGFEMAIIMKQKKLFIVCSKLNETEIYEKFYDYQSALERKKEIEETTFFKESEITASTDLYTYLYDYVFRISKTEWGHSLYEKNKGLLHNYISKVVTNMKISDVNECAAYEMISALKLLPATGKRNQQVDQLMPPSMVKASLNLLKNAFMYLVNNGIININPFLKIKIDVPTRKNISEWNLDYVRELFNHCEDCRLSISLHLMFATGLSLNEVLGLRWNDVLISDDDYKSNTCKIVTRNILKRISKDVSATHEENIIEHFKNKAFSNTVTELVLLKKNKEIVVPIPFSIAKLLREWKIKQKEYAFENTANLVIAWHDGRPYDLRILEKEYLRLRDKTHLPELTLAKLKKFGKESKDGVLNSEMYYGTLSHSLCLTYHQKKNDVSAVKNSTTDKIKKIFNESKLSNNDCEINKLLDTFENDPSLKYEFLYKLMNCKTVN